MDVFESLFATPPIIPLPQDLQPIPQVLVQWEWSHPLAAILRFGGWTIDDAVSDPRVAAMVRQLWKIYKDSKRYEDERDKKLMLRHQIRWRIEGLPVPCPVCGSREACACVLGPLLLKSMP